MRTAAVEMFPKHVLISLNKIYTLLVNDNRSTRNSNDFVNDQSLDSQNATAIIDVTTSFNNQPHMEHFL